MRHAGSASGAAAASGDSLDKAGGSRTGELRAEELLLAVPHFAPSVQIFRPKVPATPDVQEAFLVELDALNFGDVGQSLIRLEQGRVTCSRQVVWESAKT